MMGNSLKLQGLDETPPHNQRGLGRNNRKVAFSIFLSLSSLFIIGTTNNKSNINNIICTGSNVISNGATSVATTIVIVSSLALE